MGPNKYYVSALGTGFRDNDATPIGPPFFKCVEKSGWCARQFCHAAARPLNINVNHEGPRSPFHGVPFLTLEKPCKCCVFPCCCRPEMKVNFSEPTSQQVDSRKMRDDIYLGRIEFPYQCCKLCLNVKDIDDNCIYELAADCCQCGVQCKGCACESC